MALVTLHANIPRLPGKFSSLPNFTSNTIDAAGEIYGWVGQAPKSGDIRKVFFRTGTVTTGGTVDVRLETVDLSTGQPSGTLFGTNTNGSQVIGSGDDNTAFLTTLTADATVVAGDLIGVAIVLGGGGGTMGIVSFGDDTDMLFPYGIMYQGGAWARVTDAGVVGFEYSDGSYAFTPHAWPITTITTTTFNSGSTPDEIGFRVTPPATIRVNGLWAYLDLDNDATLVLYDTDGVTELATATLDASVRLSSGAAPGRWLFDAGDTAILSAGSTYRGIVRPGASSMSMYDFTVPSAAAMDSFEFGQAMYYTSAKNPTGTGDWTDVTTRRPYMGLLIDQFHDGAGGGGGVSVLGGSFSDPRIPVGYR